MATGKLHSRGDPVSHVGVSVSQQIGRILPANGTSTSGAMVGHVGIGVHGVLVIVFLLLVLT